MLHITILQFSLLTVFTTNVGGTSVLSFAQEGNLQYIYSKTDTSVQAKAAEDVVKRLLPERHDDFQIVVNTSLTNTPYVDAFKVQWNEDTERILVTGTTGVAALFGFHHYLKYFCKCHVAWEGSQLNLPKVLPKVELSHQILDRFRYYQNVCTDSYSFVWWDWTKWEEHIDWMALNGINLPLAFTGQEAIWIQVYKKLGLNEADILDYISGPAFLAWWRMGNMQKWGGPIPKPFVEKKFSILKQIIQRMRHLGMIPVLPAFSGNIPPALTKLYPNTTFVKHSSWNKFNSSYSETYMLLPTDPLFVTIGQTFITELTDVIGTDHVYSCDTYNENRPSSNDTEFLKQMAKSTFASMTAGDSKAVWMIQSWVFTDAAFWKKEQVQSYLGGVKPGNALILDLAAELIPLYIPFQSFFNHSFIWCMLHNFGGTHGLDGRLNIVNDGVNHARRFHNASKSLIGTGICPEGINQNYVMYDFMTESSLREEPANITTWVDQYQERRYGLQNSHLSDAWKLLIKNIYNCPPLVRFHGRAIIIMRPTLNLREQVWYDMNDVRDVLKLFVIAINEGTNAVSRPDFDTATSGGESLLRYDSIDFARQFLQVLGIKLYDRLLFGFYKNKLQVFEEAGRNLLQLLGDMDVLLSTDTRFLLGPWVNSSLSWSTDEQEVSGLRYNALNQITLWGPRGEIVDYAAKQWAGLFSDYYIPRWSLFIERLRQSFNSTFDGKKFKQDVLELVETPFTKSGKEYPSEARGNTWKEVERIYGKWKPIFTSTKIENVRRRKKNSNHKKRKSKTQIV